MKIREKKIYCPTCQKLVRAKEEKSNSSRRIICSNCNNAIWVNENLAWRFIKAE